MIPDARRPHVVVVGVYLDPVRRTPRESLSVWRDFGKPAAAAARQGARISVVQAAWSDAEIDVDGVTCHFVAESGPPFLGLPGGRRVRRHPRRLFDRVKALGPDLIHFEGLILPLQLRQLAAGLPATPILAQDHGTRVPRGWRRWLHRWGFAPLAGVAFTARAQAAPFVQAGVIRADLPVFEVIEGSSPFVPGDQARARAGTGLGGDPCLLWVGNLDRNKDPLTVLEAVAQSLPALPDLRLWMCYRHHPLLAEVERRIQRDPQLATRVRLLGQIGYPAIELLFRAADFLVQASHKEGSGYGIIEALACGTTPLVTDIPSFRKITHHGRVGSLTPVGDPGAMARAIVEWATRDRPGLRQAARTHFERELSFEAIGGQLRAAYQAL